MPDRPFAPGVLPVTAESDLPDELAAVAPAAAIVDDPNLDMDRFLARIVQHQQAHGLRVQGLLMQRPPRGSGCAATMELVDIETAEHYLVSQALGAGASGCRADPQGFARASRVLRAALDRAPELVVSNRFGDLEAQRGGFSAELLEIMARGIPLLTTVAQRNAEVWQTVTGGAALLPADAIQVDAWIERAVDRYRQASAA